MDQASARTRPMESARKPNRMPPHAEASRVAEAMAPAAAEVRWNWSRMVVRAKAYSITSMASSIQAKWTAARVRHCVRVMDLYQGMEPLLLGAQQREGRVEGDLLETYLVAGAQLSDAVQVGGYDVGDFG